ncbi:MAG: oxidoreductase [Bacillota bacterium]
MQSARYTSLRRGLDEGIISRRGNQRSDEYGGGIEGRARVATEIISRIKAELGREYPVIARINGDDFQPGGNTLLDAVGIAKLLVECGPDRFGQTATGRCQLCEKSLRGGLRKDQNLHHMQ